MKHESDLVNPLLKTLRWIPTVMPMKVKLPEISAHFPTSSPATLLTMHRPTGLFSVPHVY